MEHTYFDDKKTVEILNCHHSFKLTVNIGTGGEGRTNTSKPSVHDKRVYDLKTLDGKPIIRHQCSVGSPMDVDLDITYKILGVIDDVLYLYIKEGTTKHYILELKPSETHEIKVPSICFDTFGFVDFTFEE